MSLVSNYVPLNNTILHDIVSCYNKVSIGHASCTSLNKRVGLVFDDKTHRFQSYNQGYKKNGNNIY